ncbi:MAG: tRNA pseudouridine(38-40) synthase TruA [Clostridia bacterium]|nr:tRNA pseudouridine(38-40) synthase TruA [Clostridia bacterium]
MRVFLKIEYDGTNYCGWQIQPNGLSVQQVVEKAILSLTGEDVCITGSGRTDSGVHALGQVAHFDTQSSIPAEKFASALNQFLPEDVKVVESYKVDSEMHARFSAKRKTYRYSVYQSKHPRPLIDRYSARVEFPLDISAMQKACQKFIGAHDFIGFSSTGSDVKDTVREIYSASVESCGEQIIFTVCGNGFLYNMVRIMAGTLVAVGLGKISPDEMDSVILSKNRKKAGATMPPRGLTLVNVEYC